MSDLNALLTLREHQARERDALRGRVEHARRQARAAETQSLQLFAYRNDYEQRWQGNFHSGGDIQIVLHYQAFMARLSAAIEQQERVCEQARAQCERVQLALGEAERKLAATDKLIERRRDVQRQEAGRREQKSCDELAARVTWSRRRMDNPPTV
jgi:flagellar FliJ protein